MKSLKRRKIEVKAIDIKRGDHGDTLSHCIVANALYRVFGKDANITVGYTCIFLDNKHVFNMPQHVAVKINRWCDHKPVKPFSFLLREA